MPVFNNILAGAAGSGGADDFTIQRSLRIDDVSNATLTRTPSTAGNRKTWTLSFWIKRTEIGGNQLLFNSGNTSNGDHSVMRINGDRLQMYQYGHSGDTTAWSGGNGSQLRTVAQFRDPSAWMHIVVAMDTTQATASNRLKYYINGVLQTEFDSASYPAQDSNPGYWNAADLHCWGDQVTSTSVSGSADYYLAEVHMVDGTALAATDFGEFDANTGAWNPIEYSGTYGTNGFYLNFSNNSSSAALGTDSSGNSNTWTLNNISVNDGSAVTVSTATGATPIRNTTGDQGGTAASGFRTDANASNLFLALPLNTDTSDVSYSINSNSTTKSTTNQSTSTSSTQARFYGASSYWNSNNDGILVAESGSELVVGTGDYTIEFWFYDDSNHNGGGTGRCYLFDNRTGGSVVGDPPTIVGYVDGSSDIKFETSGGSTITSSQGSGGTNNKWFHYAAVRSSGTCTFYLNGSAVGNFSDTTNYPNNGIGVGRATDGGYGWAGYIQDFRFYKTAKYTSDFSVPAEANPTVGAGCDSLIDTPTNYSADSGNNGGNYATLQPLHALSASSSFANGNLEATVYGSSSRTRQVFSTINPSSGKFYFEVTPTTVNTTMIGLFSPISESNVGTSRLALYRSDGLVFRDGTNLGSVASTYAANDVIGVAYDIEGAEVKFYKNGTLDYTVSTFTNSLANAIPGFGCDSSTTSNFTTAVVNFGQRPFSQTVPTGYSSLCTTNLDDPLIEDPSTAFDVALWTGNGSTAQTISTPNLSPDIVWFKERSSTSSHAIRDSVRGATNAAKVLYPDRTDAEATSNSTQNITSLNSDGFTIGSSDNSVNENNQTYVGWAWEGGDLATNSAYNQSAVWSDHLTASGTGFRSGNPATNAFNGGSENAVTNDNNGTLTLDLSSYNLSGLARVKFGTGNAGTYSATFVGSSGTQTDSQSYGATQAAAWTSSYNVGTITSISVTTSSNSQMNLVAVEIDGKELVDTGVIPVGSLNSSVYLQDAAYNSQVSGSSQSWSGGRGDNQMFDGLITTATSALNNTITWSGSIPFTTSFAIASDNDGTANAINITHGPSNTVTNVRSQVPNTSNSQIAAGTIPITTLTGITSPVTQIELLTGSSAANGICMIKADGKIVVDSGITPPAVPSIASTVRANPTAGCSIISYKGTAANATVGHGLNTAPGLIMIKNRDTTAQWAVGHQGLSYTSNEYLVLDKTDAKNTGAVVFNSLAPTSLVINVGTAAATNGNTNDMIAYCFSPVSQYSAFGSYTGNSSSDGPFVFTNFKPRWIMFKNTTSAIGWYILDTQRDEHNVSNTFLFANTNGTEGNASTSLVDILSNGFKLRGTGDTVNTSGAVYVYAAFASSPFRYARAR